MIAKYEYKTLLGVQTNVQGNTYETIQRNGCSCCCGIAASTIGCGPAATYTISGDVTGTTETVIVTNGINGDSASSSEGYYTLTAPLSAGDDYNVQMNTGSPEGFACAFATGNNMGTIVDSDVFVDITCEMDTDNDGIGDSADNCPNVTDATNDATKCDLLGAAAAAQLADWLGVDDLVVTNVYDKVDGDTSVDFHAAADNQGATITLIGATSTSCTFPPCPSLGQVQIIGGYNPLSWNGASGWTVTDVRTLPGSAASIFNLTAPQILTQRTQYQTYNALSYGPTFGQGHDMWVNNPLNGGYSYRYGYCAEGDVGSGTCYQGGQWS